MNRQQKKELLQRQSTRQLMGIDQITEHGLKTARGELAFFMIRPDNLSVLPTEEIRGRVHALTNLLAGTEVIRFMALDSRESFQQNKNWYQERIDQETNPKIREQLELDMAHLDEIQTMTASAREFAFVFPMERQKGENYETILASMAKTIREHGFHVRLAEEQDIMRILAVYYQQDVTTEVFEHFDGESAVFNYD